MQAGEKHYAKLVNNKWQTRGGQGDDHELDEDELYLLEEKQKNLEAVNNYETDYREFDTETWDGSDIFNLQNTLLNVCTARVKELLESTKITNKQIGGFR